MRGVSGRGCMALAATVQSVLVTTLTLHPRRTLNVLFTLRNYGTTSCNCTVPYAGGAGPISTALMADPGGSALCEIENSQHTDVWPGAEVFNCPTLGFAQLAAGASVSGTATWDETEPKQ
jgi:hypothetical protein